MDKTIRIYQIAIASLLFSLIAMVQPNVVYAHRSGCHRWHTCPSDTGSYTTGDAPVNVPPPPVSPKQTEITTTVTLPPIPVTNPQAKVTVTHSSQVDIKDAPNGRVRKGILTRGQSAKVKAKTNDGQWWQVEYAGVDGWIEADSVSYSEESSSAQPLLSDVATCTQVCISSPKQESIVRGAVEIVGTAALPNFARYTLGLEDTRCSNGFCVLAEFNSPVTNGKLMTWNTAAIPNGTYLLALRVVDKSGSIHRQQAPITITVNN